MPERLVNALDRARRQTVRLVCDLDDVMFYEQPAETAHNAAWIVGHLLLFDAYIADALNAAAQSGSIDERYETAFGRGSSPRASGEIMSRENLLLRFDEIRTVLVARIGMMGEADLDAANPEPQTAKSLPTVRELLEYLLWHEGYHAGQLSHLRKVLGLPRVGTVFLE